MHYKGRKCSVAITTPGPMASGIPCPLDPSHSVLIEKLDWHVKRCPLLKQAQPLTLQPFYQKGINAGRDNDDQEEEEKV
ncbi:hypothetical protein ACB092_11G092200 [Castanea dentata]